MEIFDSDVNQLPEIVTSLNEMGVKSPDGKPWSEESFRLEMRRLGA
jgi:hypothetical protein